MITSAMSKIEIITMPNMKEMFNFKRRVVMSKLRKMFKNSRLYFVRLCARSKGVESLIKLMSQEKKPFIVPSDCGNNFLIDLDYIRSYAARDSLVKSISG